MTCEEKRRCSCSPIKVRDHLILFFFLFLFSILSMVHLVTWNTRVHSFPYKKKNKIDKDNCCVALFQDFIFLPKKILYSKVLVFGGKSMGKKTCTCALVRNVEETIGTTSFIYLFLNLVKIIKITKYNKLSLKRQCLVDNKFLFLSGWRICWKLKKVKKKRTKTKEYFF